MRRYGPLCRVLFGNMFGRQRVNAGHFLEALLLGIGLSMDALAVSLALGASEGRRLPGGTILLAAVLFGSFQAGMPLLGWLGGALCGDVLLACGKTAAALLLGWIGVKMFLDRKKEVKASPRFLRLLALAFATSVDALLAGVGYACLGVDWGLVIPSVLVIGSVTFLISAGGCLIGRRSGHVFGRHSAVAGSVVLIALAVKVFFAG